MQRETLVPTTRILTAIESRKWTALEAISELIDNSFGSERGNASWVKIFWDAKGKQLWISDNGVGIQNPSLLGHIGNGTNANGNSDIGTFGVGGSEALCWLGKSAKVSTRYGEQATSKVFEIDWPKIIESNEWPGKEVRVCQGEPRQQIQDEKESLLLQGANTIIQIFDVRKIRSQKKLRSDISRMYSPALLNGKQIFLKTNADQEYIPLSPFLPKGFQEKFSSGTKVLVDSLNLSATLEIGTHTSPDISHSGIGVWFNHRQIMFSRDFFSGSGIGLYGRVLLSPEWKPFLTTTKNGLIDHEKVLKKWVSGLVAELEESALENLKNTTFDSIREHLLESLAGKVFIRNPKVNGQRRPSTSRTSGHSSAKATPRCKDVEIVGVAGERLAGMICKSEMRPEDNKIMVMLNTEHRDVVKALEAPTSSTQEKLELIISYSIASCIERNEVRLPNRTSRQRELIDEHGSDAIFSQLFERADEVSS